MLHPCVLNPKQHSTPRLLFFRSLSAVEINALLINERPGAFAVRKSSSSDALILSLRQTDPAKPVISYRIDGKKGKTSSSVTYVHRSPLRVCLHVEFDPDDDFGSLSGLAKAHRAAHVDNTDFHAFSSHRPS